MGTPGGDTNLCPSSPSASPVQSRWAHTKGSHRCRVFGLLGSVLVGTELCPQICHLQKRIIHCSDGSMTPSSLELHVPRKPQLKPKPCTPGQHLTSACSCSQTTAYLLMWQSTLSTLLFSCRDRDRLQQCWSSTFPSPNAGAAAQPPPGSPGAPGNTICTQGPAATFTTLPGLWAGRL